MPYQSDIKVYIWQPHLAPMPLLGATICIGPMTAQGRDGFIYFHTSKSDSAGASEIDKSTRAHASEIYEKIHSSIPDALKTCSSLNIRVFLTILAVYPTMITDTARFIDSVSHQIHNLVWDFYSILFQYSESFKWCEITANFFSIVGRRKAKFIGGQDKLYPLSQRMLNVLRTDAFKSTGRFG